MKLIKANKVGAAKEKWYEWKYEWTENLLRDAERGQTELEHDEEVLDGIISQASELLPALQQQHAQILLELEREQRDVVEMEESQEGGIPERWSCLFVSGEREDEKNPTIDTGNKIDYYNHNDAFHWSGEDTEEELASVVLLPCREIKVGERSNL